MDAEKVTVANSAVTRVDRTIPEAQAYGEYIGVAKFAAAGAERLRDYYERRRREFAGHSPSCGRRASPVRLRPGGDPATMEVPDPHLRINQVSAISNEGAVRCMTYKGTMDGALFTVFLGRLLRTSRRKIFLIVDRLKAHEEGSVADWVEAHKDRIEVQSMPPRTPELNPDEYLNNDLKGNVHEAGLPANKEELRSRMQRFMRGLSYAPEHVMNYFLHPCVLYAAGT